MPDAFQPLTSGAHDSGATAFRPRVVTAQENAGAFAPLHPSSFSPAPKAPCAQTQPIVTPKRDGDRITGVLIQCNCGQVIDLSFTY